MPGRVLVSRTGEALVRRGELNVYSKHVVRVEDAKPGDLVEVLSEEGELLGVGFYESIGAIAVRLLSYETRVDVEALVYERIGEALKARERIKWRDFYRLVNADGDMMPGLIVDYYNGVAVVQSSSVGWDRRLDLVARALRDVAGATTVYLRNDQRSRLEVGLPLERRLLLGEHRTRVVVEEAGARFMVDVERGQKTGFFIDQSDNRVHFARLVGGGDRVLDLYSYTGGFTIHAALQGCRVVAVEESDYAVSELRENLKLNRVERLVEVVHGRVEDYTSKARERFTAVVADPPALIPSRELKERGLRAYTRLYTAVLSLVEDGGIAVLSSCSYFLGLDEMLRLVEKASRRAGVAIRLMGAPRGASACHLARPRDLHLRYLKVLFTIVDRGFQEEATS